MTAPINMASVAADLARRDTATRWSAEATVHSSRKNIFAFAGEIGAYHVGTLVSGSKSKLDRFEADARLIASAPELYEALAEMVRDAERNQRPGGGDVVPAKAYLALAKARGEQ